MSPERKQRLYLIFIMVLVAIGVGAISIYTLYVADLEDHQVQMVRSIHEQAKVMEAVARFDKIQSQGFPGGNVEATLAQFREAHRNFKGIGHSVEYTLAKLDKDQIVFLLSQRAPRKNDGYTKTPLPTSIPLDSKYGEPMKRALNGESGFIIGMGYLGQTVMAAYTHVDVLNFGLVMSIDLSEIKAPFIEAGLLATAGGFTIILLGVATFFRASEPLVRKLDIQNKELSDEIANRRVSEERLKLVLEGANIGTWDWNTQTNEVLFDNRFVEMLGYNQSEFEPTLSAWEKLVHPENLPNVQKLLQDHLLGKSEFYEAEYPLRHKSGHWIWVLDKGKVVEWDSEGKPLRACGTHLDISKRKEAEKQRQESEGRFSTIFEENPMGVAVIESLTGKILDINPKFSEIVGRNRDELLTLDWMGITHPDDVQEDSDNMALVNSGKISGFNMIKRYFLPDGSLVWVSLTVHKMPVSKNDSPIHFCMVEDISNRIEAEEKIEKAQKQLIASQKLAGIGELAAGVSHEVLNPVNIISVHTQMLQRKTKDDSSIQNFCNKVKHEIDRIQRIMSSLLEFSRTGQVETKKGHMRDAIEATFALVENEYKLDNIQIVRDWCDSLVDISYDPDKIRQVYLNLIHNAKHAMPDGGTITVGCNPVKDASKNFHQFTFSDTGTGMTEEVKLKIFEPFFTTKPEGEGTGLGLSVSHGIIQEHGGKIRVESEEGKGTTFIISLPIA